MARLHPRLLQRLDWIDLICSPRRDFLDMLSGRELSLISLVPLSGCTPPDELVHALGRPRIALGHA
jgi:hypothetical protein